MTEETFYSQGYSFLEKILEKLEDSCVNLRGWSVDHLCYRSNTLERYQDLKLEFARLGNCLGENQVNGRPISTYRLRQPFVFKDRVTDLVELPAPKASKQTPEGFEHIEVVCDVPFETLEREFSHLRIDRSGLSKSFNPELEIELDGCAVKFHHLSLESVICFEQNARVYSALFSTQVLELLRDFQPLVVGSFPLGISTESSDVEILASASDLALFENRAMEFFGKYEAFQVSRAQRQGVDTLIIRFSFEGLFFKLFAQPVPTVKQVPYKHFQAEEKLLKLGGRKLREQIMGHRAFGMKTEAAFANALGLEGDPDHIILNLQNMTELNILKMISRSNLNPSGF